MNILKDKIFIRNLILSCNVGVTEAERQEKQNVILDLEIYAYLNRAGATDDINQTVDYYKIKEEVASAVTEGKFKLLERLAETAAAVTLKDPSVSMVTVAVKKEKYAQNPALGIEISRERHG